MAIVVNLDEIIRGMEFQSDQMRSFLNLKTGEVVSITDEEFRAAEEDKSLEKFPDWQRENIVIAQEILEEDYYISLPTEFDIHEYNIMESFCLSIDDDKLQNIMCSSIIGSGAFRRFKDNIHRYHIEDDWYKYRDEAIKQIAIEWCEDNEIKYK
ncbi:hypothetical protein Psfp_04004 [Pelotomaculum sp. FP]|uniref:UPF0158 family protein n=1 Tax=Pelotomaculum sp. FP TaxID=261474 RepID=UPI001064C889|nr:UPF0158 family protein [Pelotomaculum sp. FP]TEB11207.1 hypothetical protein Psfp_04004 [Pelotomaculum sp. FP]